MPDIFVAKRRFEKDDLDILPSAIALEGRKCAVGFLFLRASWPCGRTLLCIYAKWEWRTKMKLHRRGNARGLKRQRVYFYLARYSRPGWDQSGVYTRSRVAEAACKFTPNSPPNTHLPRKGDITRALNFPRETNARATQETLLCELIIQNSRTRALWWNFNFNSLSSLSRRWFCLFFLFSERKWRLRCRMLPLCLRTLFLASHSISTLADKNLLNSISTPPVSLTSTSCFHFCFCGQSVCAHIITRENSFCQVGAGKYNSWCILFWIIIVHF